MAVEPTTGAETARLSEARERYVAAGVATSGLFVEHAHGADDRRRRRARVHRLRRRHRRPERRAHARGRWSRRSASRPSATCTSASRSRCTSRTSRSAGGSASCIRARSRRRRCLQNSGAEAVENAVKIAALRDRPRRDRCFDQAFHGRTLLAMTLTSKVMPYKKGFGPFAPEVYRAAAPWPYRGIGTAEALASVRKLFKSQVDPQSVAAIIYEPVQGEGGFLPATPGFLEGLIGDLPRVRDRVHRRRGAVRHGTHRRGARRRPLRRRRARSGRLGQEPRRRAAARGRLGSRGADGRVARRRARRHVRRQSAVVRRGACDPRPARRAGLPRGRESLGEHAARAACERSPRGARRSATCAASVRWSRSSSSRIP